MLLVLLAHGALAHRVLLDKPALLAGQPVLNTDGGSVSDEEDSIGCVVPGDSMGACWHLPEFPCTGGLQAHRSLCA